MEMTTVEITIPEEMKRFVTSLDEEDTRERNAILLYPFIRNQIISHGRAAEILGMHKTDLIACYDRMGFPYLDQSREEVEEDIFSISAVRKGK